MKSALLIIDVQQGLCEGEGQAFDSAAVIARINTVAQKMRQADVPVVFIQHESGPGYLEYGTPAWQLAAGLETESGDRFVRKTTPDSFLRTDLQELLQSQAVTDLTICGMHTEFCVDTTTRRALAHHNATLTNISSFGPRVRTVTSAAIQC